MAFRIIRENIINVEADAIVNTANPQPVFGSGTDTAVYEAAGKEELLKAREAIGVIAEGEAAATPAFGMHAKIIIHTVSPLWVDGNHQEIELLHRCYQSCFAIAEEQDCHSIAFPLLASGSNGFEKSTALEVALSEIQNYTMRHDMDVLLVVFDKTSYALSAKVFADVTSYIEEHQVLEAQDMEYAAYPRERRRERKGKMYHIGMANAAPMYAKQAAQEAEACDAIALPKKEDTFQARLFELIDSSGKTDPEIYKRANIDRKLFAKIRKDENYKPSRKTAVALAFALHLSLSQAQDLIGRAGFALSSSTQADLIYRYCFENKVYDITQVNSILFQFDQELL